MARSTSAALITASLDSDALLEFAPETNQTLRRLAMDPGDVPRRKGADRPPRVRPSRLIVPALTFGLGLAIGIIVDRLPALQTTLVPKSPAAPPSTVSTESPVRNDAAPSVTVPSLPAANAPPKASGLPASPLPASPLPASPLPASARPVDRQVPSRVRDAAQEQPVVFEGTLAVESTPSAEVFVDGRSMGRTPLVVRGVRAGSHVVRVQIDGYQVWASAVRVVANQRNSVTTTLIPVPASP